VKSTFFKNSSIYFSFRMRMYLRVTFRTKPADVQLSLIIIMVRLKFLSLLAQLTQTRSYQFTTI